MSPQSEALAARLRRLLADTPNCEEKPMFGGICFMHRGNMVVCTTANGTLMARVGGQAIAALTPQPGVNRMQMGTRTMRDFLEIAPDQIAQDDRLETWLAAAQRFVSTMPSK